MIMMRWLLVCCLVLPTTFVVAHEPSELSALSTADISAAPVQTYTLPQHPQYQSLNHEDYFFYNLLKLALDKTRASSGDYEFIQSDIWLADNRLKAALKSGHIDVMWSNTDPNIEREFLPVRFSLLKELSDYRVFIIRADDQARFDSIKSLDDLRKLTGGIGSQWADMAVMRGNRLPIVSSAGYSRLFKMLAAGRFDYFSRGLYQVSREVNYYSTLPLAIEKGLMLYYPSPHYFFVNPNNQALANRIEQGLKLAQADGSFDDLFYSIPRHQWATNELANGDRRIFWLEIPSKPKKALEQKSVTRSSLSK